MSDDRPKPLRNDQSEGEDAYRLAEQMLSERMVLVTALCIFVIVIVAFQWQTLATAIYDGAFWLLAKLD